MYTLQYKKLSPNATDIKLPVPGDAGVDIYASESIEIQPHSHAKISTGIALAFDRELVAIIKDRSSKCQDLHVVGGVIDSSYRGEILVVMHNPNNQAILVTKGAKIAQLVFTFIPFLSVVEVERLPESSRGRGGFGSTGG